MKHLKRVKLNKLININLIKNTRFNDRVFFVFIFDLLTLGFSAWPWYDIINMERELIWRGQHLRNNDGDKRRLLRQLRRDQEDFRSAGRSFIYFIVGMALIAGGLYLVFQNTIITTNFTLMNFFGYTPPTGVIILPLLIGVAMLFFNSKSILGWIITIFGIVSIVLGLIMTLRMHFGAVTLYQGLIMFGLPFAGAGLVLKALAGNRSKSGEDSEM